jgi:GWxTD domain-containing protein
MKVIDAFVQTQSASALGWALVHSLWQGAALALSLGIVLRAARSAGVRYKAAWVALLAMSVLFGITFLEAMPQHAGVAVTSPPDFPRSPGYGSGPDLTIEQRAAMAVPWLTPVWIFGALLFWVRWAATWTYAQRLRRTGVCAAPADWQRAISRLCDCMGVTKTVSLMESCLTEVPVVLGYLRPLILVPAGALAGLPPDQIEPILMHELAHIRRGDYFANMVQTFVGAVFFYHPAVWWILRVIRIEREHCCDDLVVRVSGDAFRYAAALNAFENFRGSATEAALAVTGGDLMKSIERLLGKRERPRVPASPVFSAGLLMLAGAIAVVAWQSTNSQTAPQDDPVVRYSNWLREDVAYIITNQERAAFRALTTDAQREEFIKQFWLRRDPTPGTAQNEFKEEHYRRIAYANSHFRTNHLSGWKTDMGRIYITFGPPDEIGEHLQTSPDQAPYVDWRYRHIEGVGENVITEFVDAERTGDFRMTVDPNPGSARVVRRP